MRSTLKDAKNSTIPATIGIGPEKPGFVARVNKAQQILMSRGSWWGTYQKARFCVSDGCLTWPREAAFIDRLSVCGIPVETFSEYYEFTQNLGYTPPCSGCGSANGGDTICPCGHLKALRRGTAPIFKSITGNQKVRLYPTAQSDVGKRVLLQGFDQNNIWIRNVDGSVIVDGEYVTLALPFADSIATFSSLTGVQKDNTDYRVLAFSVDPVSTVETAIAIWQPDENNPSYNRSYIPGLNGAGCPGTCNGTSTVEAIVKLEYIPARIDTDWLGIGNLVALEYMCQSIKAREDNDEKHAIDLERAALRELNMELRTHTGDKTEVYVDVFGSAKMSRVFRGFN